MLGVCVSKRLRRYIFSTCWISGKVSGNTNYNFSILHMRSNSPDKRGLMMRTHLYRLSFSAKTVNHSPRIWSGRKHLLQTFTQMHSFPISFRKLLVQDQTKASRTSVWAMVAGVRHTSEWHTDTEFAKCQVHTLHLIFQNERHSPSSRRHQFRLKCWARSDFVPSKTFISFNLVRCVPIVFRVRSRENRQYVSADKRSN